VSAAARHEKQGFFSVFFRGEGHFITKLAALSFSN
jgi:hypothetical protein